jgi:hypothetical protein
MNFLISSNRKVTVSKFKQDRKDYCLKEDNKIIENHVIFIHHFFNFLRLN